MIISQDLQRIFLKTKKVGGTSFEMALSKYCGEVDVITPITPNDEAQRKSLGFRSAQHFQILFGLKLKMVSACLLAAAQAPFITI